MADKKKKGKYSILNLFDIIVIIIAVLLAVLLFAKGKTRTDGTQITSDKITYTLELTGMQNGSAELVRPGDRLTDKIKKYDIGTVVSVTVKTSTNQVEDYENGGIIDSPVSGKETAVIVVEAPCKETDSQITVGGGYAVRVGASANVRGPGYAGTGYIIDIERGDG